MRLDDLPHDPEAEPEAAARRPRVGDAHEALEDALPMFRRSRTETSARPSAAVAATVTGCPGA
jgi:hypothetical protein